MWCDGVEFNWRVSFRVAASLLCVSSHSPSVKKGFGHTAESFKGRGGWGGGGGGGATLSTPESVVTLVLSGWSVTSYVVID